MKSLLNVINAAPLLTFTQIAQMMLAICYLFNVMNVKRKWKIAVQINV
jgi:hypothetical protein